MAEAQMTIGFDEETKTLIRELIDAVKKLDDAVDPEQSFGDPEDEFRRKQRLVEWDVENPDIQWLKPADTFDIEDRGER